MSFLPFRARFVNDTYKTSRTLHLIAKVYTTYKYLVSYFSEEDEDNDYKQIVDDSNSTNNGVDDSGVGRNLRSSAQK